MNPAPPKAPQFDVTDAESIRAAMKRDGFAHIPNLLSTDELEIIREAIDEILERSSEGDQSQAPDILRDSRGVPRKICYPLAKSNRLLPLLALPNIGRIVDPLAGAGTEVVLTWEDILIKPARVGAEVVVHQDLALQRGSGLVFSIGLHLHDATENPVYFLPGSHQDGALTRKQVQQLRSERSFMPVAPLAGDAVVHDVYCVHYSEANRGPTPRHAWYLEFRDIATLRNLGPWSNGWAERRRAILFHAAAARESAGETAWWPALGAHDDREYWLSIPADSRVPHLSDGVEYDLSSPYYHFGESPERSGTTS